MSFSVAQEILFINRFILIASNEVKCKLNLGTPFSAPNFLANSRYGWDQLPSPTWRGRFGSHAVAHEENSVTLSRTWPHLRSLESSSTSDKSPSQTSRIHIRHRSTFKFEVSMENDTYTFWKCKLFEFELFPITLNFGFDSVWKVAFSAATIFR